MSFLPFLANQSAQQQVQSTSGPAAATTQNQRPNLQNRLFGLDSARAEEIIRVNGGFELMIAPLYKRLLAEILDTIIIFVIKILVFVLLIDFFDTGILDDIADLKEMKFLEEDYSQLLNSQLLNLSSEFILLELLTKLLGCLYEALFIMKFGGSIGKLVLGIKVVQADAVIPLEQVNHSQGIRSLIFPASNVTFVSIFLNI